MIDTREALKAGTKLRLETLAMAAITGVSLGEDVVSVPVVLLGFLHYCR